MNELDVVALLGKHPNEREHSEVDSGSKQHRDERDVEKDAPQYLSIAEKY